MASSSSAALLAMQCDTGARHEFESVTPSPYNFTDADKGALFYKNRKGPAMTACAARDN